MNFANMTPREFSHAKASMSRRDRKQYYVSLCADPPPRVLNVRQSRKRMKYRQRMAHKRRKGDEMLSTKYFTKADAALRNARMFITCSMLARPVNLTALTLLLNL